MKKSPATTFQPDARMHVVTDADPIGVDIRRSGPAFAAVALLTSRVTQWLVAALLAIGLLAGLTHRISGARVEKDAAQNVQMALDLERQGTISLEATAPYVPSNYREPVPVFVSALAIRLIDELGGQAPPDAYFQGERVRLLKYQNLIWLALLSVGAFWATRRLSSSFYLALLGVLLVNFRFLQAGTEVDDLYTEIPAAAVLMLASLSLANTIGHRNVGSAVLTGSLFGILALIKAAFLYVFAGAILVVAGIHLLQRHARPLRDAAAQWAAMLIAFGCVIAPWIYRNHTQLGTYQISQRGGVVLLDRAVHDRMTPEEYRGTFYAWAPPGLKGGLGHVLGFSPADLRRHGRLQRLNDGDSDFAAQDLVAERAGAPQSAISFYRLARAERVKLTDELDAAGTPQPQIAADNELRNRAIEIIEQHPLTHLALTISFLWRGAALIFPILVIALWFSARRRQYDVIAFAITAFGAVLFYAFCASFFARFALPMRPIAVVAMLVTINAAINPKLIRQFFFFETSDSRFYRLRLPAFIAWSHRKTRG